jgi:pyrroloquinoline quinone biosynthesis protein D
LLLFPEGVLVLNPTAHEVVALCDGRRTIEEILVSLREKFESDAVDGDVRDLLSRLAGKGLLVIAE